MPGWERTLLQHTQAPDTQTYGRSPAWRASDAWPFTSSSPAALCACVAVLCITVQIHRCDFQQLYSEKDGHSSGVREGRGTDSIYRERSISSKGVRCWRVSVLYLLVTALASPLAWGRLSPGLGSSRFGEMVEAGLDAPLLALGLGVVGLTRTRLVRASRVPSGSTIMFMAAE